MGFATSQPVLRTEINPTRANEIFLLFFSALAICGLAFAGVLDWKYAQLFPEPSTQRATDAVNGVIDAVLAQPDGPVQARDISRLIGKALSRVFWLATEDRDRTGGYLIEVWYILGFKGATGQFVSGTAYSIADGYSEPLPLGWTTANQPRPVGP